jgi:hypothetical protein
VVARSLHVEIAPPRELFSDSDWLAWICRDNTTGDKIQRFSPPLEGGEVWRTKEDRLSEMNEEEAIVLVTALAGQAVVLAACSRQDEKPKQRHAVTSLHFNGLLRGAEYEAWFPENLRCSRSSFVAIAGFLRQRGVVFANAVERKHSFEKKIAAALYFVASSGGYRETASAMGMNKSYVVDIVDEVARVLYRAAGEVVSFPRDRQGWDSVEQGFAARRGYPGVVGAVDGSLLAIDRPEEYDGFYCRKGYPALNIQAIVTADNKFMSVEIRPGSWSDSKSWKHSVIGRHAGAIIPAGAHFIGDSGYALLPYLLVLYAEREEGGALTHLQKRFNFYHSSTRMAVECTFGLWKGRFRVLQTVMDEKSLGKTKHVIMATIVLHNLMLGLRDDTPITPFSEPHEEEDNCFDSEATITAGMMRNIGKQKRDGIANVICH